MRKIRDSKNNWIVDPDSVMSSIPDININLNIPDVVKSTDLIILKNVFDDITAEDIISDINELHLNSKQIGGMENVAVTHI